MSTVTRLKGQPPSPHRIAGKWTAGSFGVREAGGGLLSTSGIRNLPRARWLALPPIVLARSPSAGTNSMALRKRIVGLPRAWDGQDGRHRTDRKSTRLNSSHL